MTQIGPDLEEEGPYSNIPEDEFFDAVETGLEKIEEVQQIRVKLKLQNQQSQIESGQIVEVQPELDDFGTGNLAKYHVLWNEIDNVVTEQLRHALEGVSDDGWQIFADEGEMKMYRVSSFREICYDNKKFMNKIYIHISEKRKLRGLLLIH